MLLYSSGTCFLNTQMYVPLLNEFIQKAKVQCHVCTQN